MLYLSSFDGERLALDDIWFWSCHPIMLCFLDFFRCFLPLFCLHGHFLLLPVFSYMTGAPTISCNDRWLHSSQSNSSKGARQSNQINQVTRQPSNQSSHRCLGYTRTNSQRSTHGRNSYESRSKKAKSQKGDVYITWKWRKGQHRSWARPPAPRRAPAHRISHHLGKRPRQHPSRTRTHTG